MARILSRLAASVVLCLLAAEHSPAAESRRLDTGWEHYQGTLGSIWEIWRGAKASDNVAWTPVTLPHCFNARDAVDPDVRYYQGPGWYRTRLQTDDFPPSGRTLLHFDGAGQVSRVFINREQVAVHIGGYDGWTVDITDAAARALADETCGGVVPLAVCCDNSRNAETIPSDLSDFNRYGGLYRHVTLHQVPAMSLERVHLRPALTDGRATVAVHGRLHNPCRHGDRVRLAIEIRDPAGSVVHEADLDLPCWDGDHELATFSLDQPQLWSPSTPSLYACSVRLSTPHGTHPIIERFGLRSVEWVPHGPFQLNGERLLLRGTHYHEDHADVAAALPDEVVRHTLGQIKAMGANFVRLGHYQQAPLVLELCDELGLLVWEEIPWCRGGLGGDAYRQQCRAMLRAMIDQHANHPSVVLWGLGNENDWPGDFPTFDKDAIRGFMQELQTLAHELDPSRQTAIRRCDFCKDIVDVYSPSIWAGWYSGRYREYRAAVDKAIRDTPHFFHAEWGGDSHAGRFSEAPERILDQVATGQGTAETGLAYKSLGGKVRMSKDGDWSESYIVNLFDWHLAEQEQIPALTGTAAWIFKDFATPLRPENPIPRVNQKGVVARDGTPKESYYVFQSYWADEPMIHVLGHGWHTRWGAAGEAKEVRVYSNCTEVELSVNGNSAGRRLRNIRDYPAAGLRWDVVLNEGDNLLRAVGTRNGVTVVDEVRLAYQTAAWGKPARLILTQAGTLLEAQAIDAQGTPCLDAANVVRFGITGDGRLIDNRGTPDGARVVQLANGRARIRAEVSGAAVATVMADGLQPAFLSLDGVPAPAGAAAATTGRPAVDLATIDRERILLAANRALAISPVTITATRNPRSAGGPNDFSSQGDYWWPNPDTPDGLPYVRRDGQSYPDAFQDHRLAIQAMRDAVAALAAGFAITGDARYATKADELLRVFFLDLSTRMHPHFEYAQAIPGVSPGRGIGIIDGLHLIEIPMAVATLERSNALPADTGIGLRRWFGDLLHWLHNSSHGQEEAATKNNHSAAYDVQRAAFATLVGDQATLAACRRRYREDFLPLQMAVDGSFPQELTRTKPYGYSIFQLDLMATLCQLLSTSDDDLWHFALPDGRGIHRAMDYLVPYLADKSAWPLPPDVEHWAGWPARQPALLFAGLALDEPTWVDLWMQLPPDPTDPEVRRNIPITQPILWVRQPMQDPPGLGQVPR